MSNYPCIAPGTTLLLPPQLFGHVDYYRLMSRYERAYIDTSMLFDKRLKSTHRFDIVDAPGKVSLTVPVSKSGGRVPWSEVTVSDHGKWWLSMPNALATAYSRSPFYEYYADAVLSILSDRYIGAPITAMCGDADTLVRRILDIDTQIVDKPSEPTADYRRAAIDTPSSAPYWQLRTLQRGFTPHLSILDLIFNLGPEACLYLAGH